LPSGGDPSQMPIGAEAEVNQLQVVDGDVSPRIAAFDPLRELTAGDRLGLQ
jgi:hypothetical protein